MGDFRPDWQNEAAYPDSNSTSRWQWAWEFLRRNQHYAEDYLRCKDAARIGVMYDEICEKYCLESIYPPETQYIQGVAERPRFRMNSCPPHTTIHSGKILEPAGESDVVVLFSLDRSLDVQLSYIEPILKLMQKKLKRQEMIGVVDARMHWDLFPRYLRILDAHFAGTDIDVIAAVLLPNEANEYPDYKASHVINNNLTRAKEICHGGYKQFLPEKGFEENKRLFSETSRKSKDKSRKVTKEPE